MNTAAVAIGAMMIIGGFAVWAYDRADENMMVLGLAMFVLGVCVALYGLVSRPARRRPLRTEPTMLPRRWAKFDWEKPQKTKERKGV